MTHFPKHLAVVEAHIINRAITGGLRCGGMISVYDGEECVVHKGRLRQFIQSGVAATEETTFVFYNIEGQRVGSAWFVHGNGSEVLSDYADNTATNKILADALAPR